MSSRSGSQNDPNHPMTRMIGEMDLAQEMEKNFMEACRKIRGMEKHYLFGIIKGLRQDVRKWQEEAEGWRQRHREEEEEPRFQTPMDEIFVAPSAAAPPPPPPPPPPPRRAESQETVRPGRRSRSPTRSLLRTPGGTRVPEGEPPLELQIGDQGWAPQWKSED